MHARGAESASQGQSLMEVYRPSTRKPTYTQKLAAAVNTTSRPATKPIKKPIRIADNTVVVVP